MSAVTDFWNHPYYKMTKWVTCSVGQWPYQSTRKLVVHRIVIFSILGVLLAPQLTEAWKNRNDYELTMEGMPALIIYIGLIIKYVNNAWHFKKMLQLLEQMKDNWKFFSKDNGLHELHHHSTFGMKFIKIYMIQIWGIIILISIEPLMHSLMHDFRNHNGTLSRRFPIPMNFDPIDVDTWYYYLLFGSICHILACVTVLGACDLLYFTFAEHACGLFKALGHAIENLPNHDESEENDSCFEYLRSCAVIHRKIIKFVERVRKVYLWSFLGIIGLNMFVLSVSGVQIAKNAKNTSRLIVITISSVARLMHLFFECFIAQRLMDAGSNLKETLWNAKWYNTSKKTQKLIPVMLIVAQKPIVLTAGKVINMNMKTFAVVVKTAASYIRVLLAIQ